MVNFCAVFGCSNRSNREKNWSFYCLPAIITRPNDKKHELSRERRATWLARIRREDLSSDPGEFVRVCSDHFISGMLKNVTLHAKRGLIQISRYGYFHGLGREMKKNYWNVSEISPTHREHAMKKVTATVKYFTP